MAFTDAARAAAGWDRGSPQVDRLGGSIEVNNAHFLTNASWRPRDWWSQEAEQSGFTWDDVVDLALELIETRMFESDFERACRLAEANTDHRPSGSRPADYRLVARDGVASVAEIERFQAEAAKRRRSTPETTIEAVWHCVRTRGVGALQEPANIERLRTFDDRARKELNSRIDRLMAKAELAA